MHKTYTPPPRKLLASVGAVVATAALALGLVLPAQAASVPKYDIVTHPVPSDYQQFVLDTTRIQTTQVSFSEHWYQTTSEGKTAFYPLSKDAAVTVHNVGTWTDTAGTHAIDMTMSVQDWQGGLVLFKDGGLWFRTSGHSLQTPAPVLQAWHTIFKPVDGRDGDTWRVDFTYADTHQPVPDTFKGITGFNDLDGGDNFLEGVELVSGFTGAYMLPHAELQAFGNNGWYGIIHDTAENDLNHGVQTLHRLTATFSGSSFVFRYSVNHTSRVDPWSTFGVPLDPAQLRVMVTTVFVNEDGTALRSANKQTLGIGDSWHVVPPNIDGYKFTGLGKSSDALDGTVTSDNIADRTVILTYARKTANKAIVSYNLKGGDGVIPNTVGKVDETVHVTDKTPPRNGYSFTGWQECKTSTPYKAGAEITLPEGGVELCAQWDKLSEPVEPAEPAQPHATQSSEPQTATPTPDVEQLAQTGASTVIIAVACGVLVAVAAALVLVRQFLQRR